jgi:predicted transcriptional regulator
VGSFGDYRKRTAVPTPSSVFRPFPNLLKNLLKSYIVSGYFFILGEQARPRFCAEKINAGIVASLQITDKQFDKGFGKNTAHLSGCR